MFSLRCWGDGTQSLTHTRPALHHGAAPALDADAYTTVDKTDLVPVPGHLSVQGRPQRNEAGRRGRSRVALPGGTQAAGRRGLQLPLVVSLGSARAGCRAGAGALERLWEGACHYFIGVWWVAGFWPLAPGETK